MIKAQVLFFLTIPLICGCNQGPDSHPGNPPNIILMMADDLGYNDLSCYRVADSSLGTTPTTKTPFIDGLAKSGMRFTNFYSGAAVCSPSRAAFLTGRNKTRLGIYNWIPGNSPMHLRNGEITIAEMLKKKGYLTGHFGKWHLTSENMGQPEPLDQGFDHAFWTYNNANPSHKDPINFISNREKVGELKGYSSHLVVEEAMKYLDGRKNDQQPFYLNIWFHEPHAKEAAPDSLKQRHKKNRAYYGCIENMDYAVGKLLEYLRLNNLDDNTLIMFTSDNGSMYPGSNAPFRGEKCFQYEGGIRMPFIASWKNRIPSGTTSEVLGHFTDVLPTIAGITKSIVPDEKPMDGMDIKEILLGTTKDVQRDGPVFFYRYFHDPICMLRQGDMVLLGYRNRPKPRQHTYDEKEEALFKPLKNEPNWSQWAFQKGHMDTLVLQEPKYFELYDVIKDPGQYHNISPKYYDLTQSMKNTMLRLRQKMVAEGGNWFKGN